MSLATMSGAPFPPGLGEVLERPDQCDLEAEPSSLTSEAPERSKSVTPQMKSTRWKTAGVIHYLSLCNKQMPFGLL